MSRRAAQLSFIFLENFPVPRAALFDNILYLVEEYSPMILSPSPPLFFR
jgi:hypothetical protein